MDVEMTEKRIVEIGRDVAKEGEGEDVDQCFIIAKRIFDNLKFKEKCLEKNLPTCQT